MALQCGIVGLPNVGKSSLFNALTASAAAAAENYPFCTIDPNVGLAPLADARLDQIATVAKSAKTVPAAVRLVDIAGLVRGAASGEGLGNKFLSHIREVDAIVHVLRCFEDADISHVEERVDPVADAQTVELELALADLETVHRVHERNMRLARSGDKEAAGTVALCERLAALLDRGCRAGAVELSSPAEEAALAQMCLLTAKPTLYCANLSEDADADAGRLAKVREMAAGTGAEVVVVCARFEAELAVLNAAEQRELLSDLGMELSGLARLAAAAYRMLGLHTFFTAGPSEARAWQIAQGATAEEAAGCIHTDMQRGFIKAEVTGWREFIEFGGESGCRDVGKMRAEGRNYVMSDGDVAHFRFNV